MILQYGIAVCMYVQRTGLLGKLHCESVIWGLYYIDIQYVQELEVIMDIRTRIRDYYSGVK